MIRKKAPDQEMQGVLATIVNKAAEQGVEDPSIVAVDAFMTAICHIGSKSLSHVLSYIDRCRVRLLVMVQDSDVAKRQIINSVLEYWKDQPGVGISILDKLLNYSILSPMSVIDWTLVHDESKGRKLSQNHVYELFYNTVIKVTSRIRQLAERPRDTNSAEEQAQQLEKDHQEEVAKMRLELRQLSEVIEAQLVSISNSHADEMSQDAATGDEETMIKWWADQWLRAYRRLFAVEDAVVNDILEARQYPIHVPQAATSGEADISEMLTKEEW